MFKFEFFSLNNLFKKNTVNLILLAFHSANHGQSAIATRYPPIGTAGHMALSACSG